MYGYQGKILFADLSDGTLDIQDLPEDVARDFTGGPGLSAYYMYKHTPQLLLRGGKGN